MPPPDSCDGYGIGVDRHPSSQKGIQRRRRGATPLRTRPTRSGQSVCGDSGQGWACGARQQCTLPPRLSRVFQQSKKVRAGALPLFRGLENACGSAIPGSRVLYPCGAGNFRSGEIAELLNQQCFFDECSVHDSSQRGSHSLASPPSCSGGAVNSTGEGISPPSASSTSLRAAARAFFPSARLASG